MVRQFSLILLTSFTAMAAQADTQRANYENPASKEETTGFVSGLIVGAATGGPPGAIVGGAIGALIGDGWNARGRAEELQVNLYESQLQFARLRDETEAMQREYRLAQQELDRLRSAPARSMPAYLPGQVTAPAFDNTAISVHFRSGSSNIEAHYQDQLESLVNLARQMDSASVEITGYADRNGDADKNLQLSRQRSDAVKRFFNGRGIKDSSITTIAYGETRPVAEQQSFETDFFDRRVIVRLKDNNQSLLSKTPLD